RQALDGAASELEQAGIANGRGEAEILLGRLLGAGRAQLYLAAGDPFDTGSARTLALWLLRRRAGEPIQYIVGEAAYRNLVLEVGPGCFIPRPETELLVDEVLAFLAERQGARPRVLECCTGSGAIGLAIAGERPDAVVVATELSPRALAFAARNRERIDRNARFHLVHGDLATALRGPFDVLVANPPYVAESERPILPREVLDHEPEMALFAREEGLAAIVRLIEDGARLLSSGGLLALELGESQGEAVRARLEAHPAYDQVRIRLDLAGKSRMALARRAGRDRATR
ncbi:MAG: peptide chain release factor N(5)-glutamine methyltransferase, partial [Candidatus Eiseniibacteriota bacterium]